MYTPENTNVYTKNFSQHTLVGGDYCECDVDNDRVTLFIICV